MVADNSLVVAGNSENHGGDSLGWTLEGVVKKFGGGSEEGILYQGSDSGVLCGCMMRSAVNFVNRLDAETPDNA